MVNKIICYLSGEFFLNNRPNGGTVILLRSVFVTAIIYSIAIALKSSTEENATFSLSFLQLKSEINQTIPWLGAILGGVYAAFYSRFSAQWSYLSSLYNQIMATYSSLSDTKQKSNETFSCWQAAFIEDALELHLATKPMFAVAISEMLLQESIRETFINFTVNGKQRLEELEAKLLPIIGKNKRVKVADSVMPPITAKINP